MNPVTESILKAMGLVAGDSTPDPVDGMISFFVPRTPFHIRIFPAASPKDLLPAIWAAGGEAQKKEIRKAHEAYLATLK